MSFTTILAFLVVGILQEALIVSYHRSINQNRFFLASCCTGVVNVLSLLLVAELSKAIFIGQMGFSATLGLVCVFAFARSCSSYFCLRWWHSHYPK